MKLKKFDPLVSVVFVSPKYNLETRAKFVEHHFRRD